MRRLVKSNLIHLAKTKSSSQKYQTARTRKKAPWHLDQEHIKLLPLSKSKPQIMPETILTAFSSDKSHRVSSQKLKEESFGSMKEKLHTPDRLSRRIQDPVITTIKRKKTISKTELSRRKPSTQLLIVVTQDL